MTSRQQRARNHYDHILPFIEEAAEEYYGGNLDRGFRHWAFATVFGVGHDLQGNDIVEYTAIDGSDDFEIDGYFIPDSDDESVVHLFQSKHRTPGTSMGPAELAAFMRAPNRILNATEVASCHNEETKALHDRLIAMLKANGGKCSIGLVWATSGNLTPAARKNAEENRSWVVTTEVVGNPTDVTVTLDCLDIADIRSRHDTQQQSDDVILTDYTFDLEEGSYHQSGAEAVYPTLSMTVPVKQIINVFARHEYKIFRLNPRGPLGNKVNAGIKASLLDATERKRFHLLNNGITAICESWSRDGNQLRVRDFQIINGCQTTVTLWDARASVQDDPAVLVTVKLTECPVHFALRIASTTNTQTVLRAEDFISNEPIQDRLKREFDQMNPRWFYQIKRGEWRKMMGGQREKEVYRDPAGGYRQLNSKEVSQAIMAFAGFPGEAKDNIRSFLNKEGLSSDSREASLSYDAIYTPTVSAVQLLLPAVIQRKVWKQVVLEDKSADDWLEYARFHIVWLVGDLLREHYQLEDNLFPAERASRILVGIDEWFIFMYEIAIQAIRNTLEDSKQRGEFSGNREFFRTPLRYRAIESNVHGAFRLASRFGDPTAKLPA